MVSPDTRITVIFIVIAAALWWGAFLMELDVITQLAILVGVGIVLPTIVNQWREGYLSGQ